MEAIKLATLAKKLRSIRLKDWRIIFFHPNRNVYGCDKCHWSGRIETNSSGHILTVELDEHSIPGTDNYDQNVIDVVISIDREVLLKTRVDCSDPEIDVVLDIFRRLDQPRALEAEINRRMELADRQAELSSEERRKQRLIDDL